MNSIINPKLWISKNTLQGYKKERIYFREKESKKVPSFNQPRPKSNKV